MPPTDRKTKKSGDPRKKVSTARTWKKSSNAGIQELELPSGNVCRLKRPGLPALMAEGMMPDLLTPLANKAIEAGRSGAPQPSDKEMMKELGDAMETPEGLTAIFDVTDRITAFCVVEPPVRYHKRKKAAGQADQIMESYKAEWEDIPENERDGDYLYTDEVDEMDKMFIMQFVVGGSRDLESFRSELGESVAGMEALAGSEEDPG